MPITATSRDHRVSRPFSRFCARREDRTTDCAARYNEAEALPFPQAAEHRLPAARAGRAKFCAPKRGALPASMKRPPRRAFGARAAAASTSGACPLFIAL
ncbi:hypothetical protein MRX96_016578 [Rhipicephalus microplus]